MHTILLSKLDKNSFDSYSKNELKKYTLDKIKDSKRKLFN